MSDLRITVIGTGYLGATHAACMAELGFEVLGLDVDKAKIDQLSEGRIPFFEPGLDELLRTPRRHRTAALHHLLRGGRRASATCTSCASAPRRSRASSPPT